MAKWSEIGCAVRTHRVPLRLLFCSQYIQLFRRERLSEKMCRRQSRKVIRDKYINTLFLTLSLSNLPLLLSFNTRKHTSLTSCVFLSNFLEIKTQNHPQYLSALSSALFPTTFLEIAVNRLSWNSRPCLKMADWTASCRYLVLLIAVFVYAICAALLIRVNKGMGICCCGSILSLVPIFFPLFLGMVMYDNEFETKENNI